MRLLVLLVVLIAPLVVFGAKISERNFKQRQLFESERKRREREEWLRREAPLEEAVAHGVVERVRDILAEGVAPEELNSCSRYRETPLRMAVDKGSVEMVKALLAAGARPDNRLLLSAIYSKVKEQDMLEMVKALLAAGANPNYHGRHWSPLLAAVMGTIDSKKRAEREGKYPVSIYNLSEKDRQGDLKLFKALGGRLDDMMLEMVKALLAAGANPNYGTAEGLTPLLAAAVSDRKAIRAGGCTENMDRNLRLELVKVLLAAGADPATAQDAVWEARPRDWEMVELLEEASKEQARQTGKMGAKMTMNTYERLFGFYLKPGLTILAGGGGSGVREYVKGLKDAFTVRGSTLGDKDSYNAIVGLPKGYVDSEHATEFYKYLKGRSNGTVVIENAGAASNAILDEFVATILGGSFKEQAGDAYGRGPVSTKNVKLVLVVDRQLGDAAKLEGDDLRNELRRLYNDAGRPLLNDGVIEAAKALAYFYPLRFLGEEPLRRELSGVGCADPTGLARAAVEFEMANTEINDKLYASKVEVREEKGRTTLRVGDAEQKAIKRLTEANLRGFAQNLKQGYLGQEEAREAVMTGLLMKLEAEGPKRDKPIVMLCIGPPGVGKTEIAKRLGDSVDRFVRVNGNTVRDITDLVGSAQKPGQLAELMKGVPNVLLIDELEKLDAESIRSLLQLTDEGMVDDRYRKETYKLQDLLIIMTSNILTDPNISEDEARETLKGQRHIPEEFIDRVDIIVPFRHFSMEEKREIAKMFAAKEKFTPDEAFYASLENVESIRQIEKNVRRAKAAAKLKSYGVE